MWRSATRWSRCCHSPRGSSEKQIFGNCVLPESCANQVLARLLLESGFLLLHESPIGGLQVFLGLEFRPHSSFRQSDQGTAHRKPALFRNAPDFSYERRGNGNALTDRLGPGGAMHILGSALHTSMLADSAPVWCRLGQRGRLTALGTRRTRSLSVGQTLGQTAKFRQTAPEIGVSPGFATHFRPALPQTGAVCRKLAACPGLPNGTPCTTDLLQLPLSCNRVL